MGLLLPNVTKCIYFYSMELNTDTYGHRKTVCWLFQVLGNWHSTKSYNSAFSEQDLVILILIVVLNWFSLLLFKHGTFLIFKNVLETELQYMQLCTKSLANI